MTIYAIRHLITPWNRQGLLQGHTDIELIHGDSDNDRISRTLKHTFKNLPFDRVVVSPMKRAVQTAGMLGCEDFIVEDLVTEMSFGRYEGKQKSSMLKDMEGRWQSSPLETELAPELFRLQDRIVHFLEKYSSFETVLLISHGAYVRALNAFINHGNLQTMNQIEFGNGELMKLEWNDGA